MKYSFELGLSQWCRRCQDEVEVTESVGENDAWCVGGRAEKGAGTLFSSRGESRYIC
jgi:hypothetical protein